jgi:hypothetical protein
MPIITDEEIEALRAEVEADEERFLIEFQKRNAPEMRKRMEERQAERQAHIEAQRRAREEQQRQAEERRKAAREAAFRAEDDHHRAIGGFLKFIEAGVMHLHYTTYLNNRDVTKALDGLNKAIQDVRRVLDYQRSDNLDVVPGDDAYFGPEIAALQKLSYQIEVSHKLRQKNIKAELKAVRAMPVDRTEPYWGPTPAQLRLQQKSRLEAAMLAPLPDPIKEELDIAIGAVVNAARQQPQLFDALPVVGITPAAITDRHSALRAALIENPDQPQAVFVERFRAHPRTVRRTRRELEQAGEIPVLTHRLRNRGDDAAVGAAA